MNMDIGSQFQLLGQQVGNLAEILGRTLLPVVTPIIQGISKAVLFFQRFARSMPGLTRVLLTLSMALGAVLVIVGGVNAAVGTIGLMLPAIKAGLAAMSAPYQAAKSALSFVRNLLPFSDSKEGPLADLTRSGAALIQTLAGGITKAASAPAEAMTRAFGFMTGLTGKIAAPAMLAGTLALTPVMAGETPPVASDMESTISTAQM